MDIRALEIDPERIQAGSDYLVALRALGLSPEGLFWAWDKIDERFVLVLVSRYFDIVGPTKLSGLLFKAYNAAATPKEIDPFVVKLHSPDHHMIRGIISALDDFKAQVIDRGHAKWTHDAALENGSIAIPLERVYVLTDVRRPKIDLLRKWGFIERKVEALAA